MPIKDVKEMLEKYSEEEREAILKLDDAMDNLMCIRLKREYGVEVECNPDGDRTKIKIDGVVMDGEEFAKWLLRKDMEKSFNNLMDDIFESEDEEECEDEEDYDEDDEDEEDDEQENTLPSSVRIKYKDLEDPYDEKEIRSYLRNKYNHYLSGKCDLNIDQDDDDEIVYIDDIEWGRKR